MDGLYKNSGAQCCISKGNPLSDQRSIFWVFTFPSIMLGNVEKNGTTFKQ